MRRRAGIAAIHDQHNAQRMFSDKSSQLQLSQLEQLNQQLLMFREHLQRFAAKHRGEIRRDAKFRQHFQEMCAAIGVDPLASSKGFWCQLLGVGDFYYELAVRIVETCMAAAARTGGLMPIAELQQRLSNSSSSTSSGHSAPSLDDIERAIAKLAVLGPGVRVLRLAGPAAGSGSADGASLTMVQSVPEELSGDQLLVLQLARSAGGRYCSGQAAAAGGGGWSCEREQLVLQLLVRDQLVWLDEQTDSGRPEYWFPSLFQQQQ